MKYRLKYSFHKSRKLNTEISLAVFCATGEVVTSFPHKFSQVQRHRLQIVSEPSNATVEVSFHVEPASLYRISVHSCSRVDEVLGVIHVFMIEAVMS